MAEYQVYQSIRLGRLEIHITLYKPRHRCRGHCFGIVSLTVNLTFNKKQYTNPC